MRRIMSHSTAIAVCLSMLSPHAAMTQDTRAGAAPLVLAQAGSPDRDEDRRKKPRRAAEKAAKQEDRAQRRRDENDLRQRAERRGDDAPAKRRGNEDRATRPQEPETRRAEPKGQAPRRPDRRAGQAAPKREAGDGRNAPRRGPDAAAAAPVRRAGSETATIRARRMAGLSGVLDREIAGGLRIERLACLSGGVFPCGRGDRLVTPRGVVLERDGDGAYLLAPAAAQIHRVDGDGRIVPRDRPDRETGNAAREAARETRAAKAAALDEAAARRELVRKRITEADRRSSSQDFSTSIRDALSRTEGRGDEARKKDDDDNDSDLLKALALGLGAVAVGAMLNNGRQVALSSPDRVVVTRDDGSQEVIKDETVLLRQPGSEVTTENFDDGSSRTIVTRPDGSKVVTIRDAGLRVLRRTLIAPDGRTTRLIDETEPVPPVDIASLPAPAIPSEMGNAIMDEAALRAALQRESDIDRRFSLGQIRNIPEVRALVAPVDIEAITFETGSAAIRPDQARQLSALGAVIGEAVTRNAQEMFLIEGHTDMVGPEAMNLALSDRRAESVALALTEYFAVPPENLVVQGYGEQFPKIRAEGDIRENRRASVRRITDLLQTARAQ